jgi:taurine dioxygenase
LTITHVTRNGESEREEMRMDIAPVTPTIGAEVSGLDLSREIEPAIADRIYDAVINHLVLFFRNQNLSPQAQFEFSRTFGSPARPHPVYPHLPGFDRVVLLENDGDRPPDTDDWHSDLTFQPNPPFLSVLYAEHIPPCGGDTLWANMYAAYENLPAEEALNTGLASVGSAVHPIAPKHPVTGRRLLFVNRSFTQHIVGMLKSESDRLLQYLFSHLENPSYQVRFRWQKGSVAIWDNRSTQHYAVADYLPDYRRMHRVIIDTDKRVAASD